MANNNETPKPNFIDRTIGYFNPVRAVRRQQARNALKQIRKYDAATTGRRGEGWTRGDSSANAQIRTALKILRNRSRDLARNNPHAKKAINKYANDVIATGIRAKITSTNEADQTAAQDAWKSWALRRDIDVQNRKNVYGIQHLAVKTMVESGEALIRRRRLDSDTDLSIPMQLQVLEPDYIDDSHDGVTNGETVIQGIKYDERGREIGAFMWSQHPGDTYTTKNFKSEFVPASEYIRLYVEDRPGQVHGVPWLAPVMLNIRDFGDYNDAQLLRQKMAACFVAFVHDTPDAIASDTSKEADKLIDYMEPGLVEQLPPGRNITFGSPPAAQGYGEFRLGQLQDMAAGSMMTYEALTSDLSKVNYSSARLGFIDFSRWIQVIQWLNMKPQMLDPLDDWFNEGALINGTIKNRVAFDWTPPRMQQVDPTREVPAMRAAVRSGFKSPREAIEESSGDYDRTMSEWAEFAEQVDEEELIFDTDPRRVSAAGLTQARQTSGGGLDFPEPGGAGAPEEPEEPAEE